MTDFDGQDEPASCACGSGLRASRCCDFDWNGAAPGHDLAPEIDGARAAAAEGDLPAANRLLIALLERSPNHALGLKMLADLCAARGQAIASRALLARVVALDPNDLAATQALALQLFKERALALAEHHARNAVRIAPTNAQSHNLMGMIMTEARRPQVGEHHYRQAMTLLDAPSAILTANLAWNLKNQGRIAEARALYERSVALDPGVFQTLFGWARMEETDRNFARAGELLDAAERLSPGNPNVLLQRAILFGRLKAYDKAMEALKDIESRRDGGGLSPAEWSEKGLLLDRMGRHPEAFAAFSEAKRQLRSLTGQAYLADEAQALVRRLTSFFTADRLRILPRAQVRPDIAQPIFIVGFPRSGTTMIEQTLSAHPSISAGDELPIIHELTGLLPRMLNSPLAYPEAFVDLWMGDQIEALDSLRDHYLQRARQLGAIGEGAAWFTDKMPLNETHLGMIGLIFPDAPIIHLRRHPLDVVLSVFSNHLTHGFFCAYDLESIARHYVLISDLVEHYLGEMDLNYLSVRYEDVIDNQEACVREMLQFVGAEFHGECLNFHKNQRYARTASYAQVAEKLYDRSRYRYRAYLDDLAPVLPILESTIHRLGYSI